jgi:hypothetical protein
MHTIDKTIDGKSVSFWLDNSFIRASIGERVIGDVAAQFTHPTEGIMWTRARDWHLFSATVLDPLPQETWSHEIASLRVQLFDVVISVGEQLRKEAA